MITKPTTWILDVQEDPETGEFFLEFPQELLESQGWKEGTVLQWDVDKETGDVTLKKAD
jgi:phytoene/squalene synthetase